jgi:hypothetical protein
MAPDCIFQAYFCCTNGLGEVCIVMRVSLKATYLHEAMLEASRIAPDACAPLVAIYTHGVRECYLAGPVAR